MKRREVFVAMAGALVLARCTCSPSLPGLSSQRPAEFAGSFYEPDPVALTSQIDGFLEQAEALPEPVQAVVVPHAGHSFAGPLIGQALGAVRGRRYARIVEISSSHLGGYEGAALPAEGGFDTPLGPLEVDSAAVALLAQYPPFARRAIAFDGEYALEVIHPFLRRLWPQAKLIPVLLGEIDERGTDAIARGLRNVLDEETLFVATATLTHFSRETEGSRFSLSGGPAEIRARVFDYERPFLAALFARDAARMQAVDAERPMLMCARPALEVLLRALGPGAEGRLLGQATSLEQRFDPAAPIGVSYFAALFPGRLPAIPALDPEDRLALGAIAEEAVAAAVHGREERRFPALSPRLRQSGGAFVTLERRGQLQGCMGRLQADNLALAVQMAGRMAASSDPRFPALRPDDLGEVELEISVLGPFQPMTSPEDFEPGRHGVVLTLGPYRGLLLPQVATKFEMDRDAFLRALSEKAGLPPDGYLRAELARFGVEAFSPRPAVGP